MYSLPPTAFTINAQRSEPDLLGNRSKGVSRTPDDAKPVRLEMRPQELAGVVIKRFRRAAEPRGCLGEAERIKAMIGECRGESAQADSVEAEIRVAGIGDGFQSTRCGDGGQCRPRNIKQRPRQKKVVELLLCSHGSKPVDTRAPREPQ